MAKKESFKVVNVSKGIMTFFVNDPNFEDVSHLARHHRRKIMRNSKHLINLPSNIVVDLVEQTGMTVKQLKSDAEMKRIMNLDAHRFRVIYDSDIMTPPNGYNPVYF